MAIKKNKDKESLPKKPLPEKPKATRTASQPDPRFFDDLTAALKEHADALREHTRALKAHGELIAREAKSPDEIMVMCMGRQTGGRIPDLTLTLAQAGISGQALAKCLNASFGRPIFSPDDFPPTSTVAEAFATLHQKI